MNKIDLSGVYKFIDKNPGHDTDGLNKRFDCKGVCMRRELARLTEFKQLFRQYRGQRVYFYSAEYAKKHSIAVKMETPGARAATKSPVNEPSRLTDMGLLNKLWPANRGLAIKQ